MNLRLFGMTFTALVLCASASAATTPGRRRPASAVKPSGGVLFSRAEKKHIAVINEQNLIAQSIVQDAVDKVKLQLHAPVEIVAATNGGTVSEKIDKLLREKDVGACFALATADSGEFISFAPDTGKCVVNLKNIVKDGASEDVVRTRTQKLIWRAFGLILGAGESIGGYTVLQRAKSLEELDAISSMTPSPEQHNRMVDSLASLDIKMIKVGTYRQACREGWAHEPTNEVQLAIWNEIHSIPATPMKIEFDPKKGR